MSLKFFLEKEFSAENIHFWAAVEDLKKLPLSKVQEKVNEIYRLVWFPPGMVCRKYY